MENYTEAIPATRTETPMSLYASMIQRRYWRKHKRNKGYTKRNKK